MESRFSKQSDLYARYRPDYPPQLYEVVLKHVDERDCAWDCATGPGQVATVLSEYFGEVYASDISHEQMSHAPERPNVSYYAEPAEDTGFPADTFNLITVAQAIHWFNFEKFYKEVRRTAGDNAMLAVFGYGMLSVGPAIDEMLHAFYERMFTRYFNDNRKYLDEHYRTIPFPFEEIPTPEFEQTYRWKREHLAGFLNSWSPVQKFKDDHDEHPVEPFMNELDAFWKDGELKTVEFPIFLRLGIVT